MRKCSGAFVVLVIANAVVSFAAWGQRSTAQAYKNAAGMFADVSEAKSPSAALMVAQAKPTSSVSAGNTATQTLGVCFEASVSEGLRSSVQILPDATVENYLADVEKLSDWHVSDSAVITILENSAHGSLSDPSGNGRYLYTPTAGYFGPDKATFLVDTGNQKFELVYFIHVDSMDDADNHFECGKSPWLISLSQNNVDPSAVAFGLPEPMSSGVVKNVNVSLNVVKLTDVNVLISTSSSIALNKRDVKYGWVLKLRSKIPSGSRRKEVAI